VHDVYSAIRIGTIFKVNSYIYLLVWKPSGPDYASSACCKSKILLVMNGLCAVVMPHNLIVKRFTVMIVLDRHMSLSFMFVYPPLHDVSKFRVLQL
jgi:hypothetical protein